LKVDRNSISKWISLYELKYDNTKKKELEKERLQSFRELNSKKVHKTSYTYIVISPNNQEFVINKLVTFCKERNIDYRSLRNTYNKIKSNGQNCKSKGYYIKHMYK
jgi:hypothetical protein